MTSLECAGFFLLKFKSELAQVFWKFKARVENESGCKIQIVRFDIGKEYNMPVTHFNKTELLKEEIDTSWRWQDACCMKKKLPKKFWAEAANTVVFLQNRLPQRQ